MTNSIWFYMLQKNWKYLVEKIKQEDNVEEEEKKAGKFKIQLRLSTASPFNYSF